jgi:hypothetical protein
MVTRGPARPKLPRSPVLVHYVVGEIFLWRMSHKPVCGQHRVGMPQIHNQWSVLQSSFLA